MKHISKHIPKTLSLVLAIFVLTGCSAVRFNVVKDSSSYSKTVESRQTFFIGGLWQREGFNAAKKCGGAERVVAVEYKFTAMDGILTLITAGLYAPRTAIAYCK